MPLVSAVARLACAAFVIALTACSGNGSAGIVPDPQRLDDARRAESVNSITPVVYVAGKGSIYAYALSARGNTPPNKVLAGEYNAADGTAIAGIATDRKATLYVLVNFGALTPGGPGCHVLEFPADATASTAPTIAYRCAPGVFFGAGIASGPNGEIDVLDTIDNVGATGFSVERFFPGGGTYATSSLRLKANHPYAAIGAGAAGNLFVGYSASGASAARIEKYAALATGNAAPVAGIDIPSSFPTLYGIASGRGRVWMTVDNATAPTPSSAAFIADPALSTIEQSLTTFGNTVLTALAVDASGIVWFGLTSPSSTQAALIRASGPVGSTTLMGGSPLNNPVRRPNPAGAYVTGIAIAQ